MFTRGLEYLVLFFAAHYMTKENYGELEFYKKVIEVGASVFAFGFPALIVSYTKGEESKKYFFVLGTLFVFLLAIISTIFLGLFDWLFLLIPFVFYALFFNGGITPGYLLVKEGSDYASYYKIVVSILFYASAYILIYFFDVTGYTYVLACYLLFPLLIGYTGVKVWQMHLVKRKLIQYYRLFKKLLISSFTLVVSNFANLMFLYTDIFILKLFSYKANLEIADFSFALNVANLLLLIPLTLVQVDIEKLKEKGSYLFILNKKITLLVILATTFLAIGYLILVKSFFVEYQETVTLFLIILTAKVFHSFSALYGTNLLILKRFKENLIVNLSMLLLNLAFCYIGYKTYGIHGVASTSAFFLALRYFVLRTMNKKYMSI